MFPWMSAWSMQALSSQTNGSLPPLRDLTSARHVCSASNFSSSSIASCAAAAAASPAVAPRSSVNVSAYQFSNVETSCCRSDPASRSAASIAAAAARIASWLAL